MLYKRLRMLNDRFDKQKVIINNPQRTDKHQD
jgi:hypothetical protein